LANDISMERVLHEDGYSIRLRVSRVDAGMVDLLMDELRRRLSPLGMSGKRWFRRETARFSWVAGKKVQSGVKRVKTRYAQGRASSKLDG